MKTKITKVLALTLCAVLLVVGSVMGTVAYLTAQDSVTNTFTYGNVAITMDEVNAEGEGRDKVNAYKLVPGQTYTKNTTIYVEAGSEECYLFVEIDADLISVAASVNFATGWTRLGATNVYYYAQTVDASSRTDNISVTAIETFTLKTDLGETLPTGTMIKAYAVQQSGFDTAEKAWIATFSATVTPSLGNGTT